MQTRYQCLAQHVLSQHVPGCVAAALIGMCYNVAESPCVYKHVRNLRRTFYACPPVPNMCQGCTMCGGAVACTIPVGQTLIAAWLGASPSAAGVAVPVDGCRWRSRECRHGGVRSGGHCSVIAWVWMEFVGGTVACGAVELPKVANLVACCCGGVAGIVIGCGCLSSCHPSFHGGDVPAAQQRSSSGVAAEQHDCSLLLAAGSGGIPMGSCGYCWHCECTAYIVAGVAGAAVLAAGYQRHSLACR